VGHGLRRGLTTGVQPLARALLRVLAQGRARDSRLQRHVRPHPRSCSFGCFDAERFEDVESRSKLGASEALSWSRGRSSYEDESAELRKAEGLVRAAPRAKLGSVR
jgi:hypothetical protein